MADISGLKTFTSGAVTSASDVNQNFYKDSNNSFKAINGYLDSDNTAASWTVGAEQIRGQPLANGKMVGLTGNLDYHDFIFPTDKTDAGAYTTVPGASLEFYLPYDPTMVLFTWMIVATNSANISTDDEHEFKVYIDGTFAVMQLHAVPPVHDTVLPSGASNFVRRPFRDRVWSGHFIRTDLTQGFHSVEVRTYNENDTSRVRVRNMKVIYFR